MDFERCNTSDLDNRISLTELEEQNAFTLDVDVEKGEKIFGNNDKAFYRAEWLNGDKSPIVLIEKKVTGSMEEILFNITLAHPHIIATYGFVNPNGHRLNSNSVLILQEYAEAGDLGSLLSQKHFIPDQNVFLEIFIQIAEAMVFLAERNIIHGDLACRNVLVFKSHPHDPKKNLVKLIDFGLTRNSSGSSNVNREIPVRYAASEIIGSRGRWGYSEQSDVFSFATFMWEACSFGQMPFQDIGDDNEVCRQKLAGKRLTRPNKCDPNIWKLMDLCWHDRPDRRPDFKMILTQLKNIQNVESTRVPSNSRYSSSTEIQSLFQVEYKICQNCHLRYTDYNSHLNNCSEHEVTCERCFNQYRRGNYSNHQRNCHGVPDDLTFSQILDENPKPSILPKNRGLLISKSERSDSYHLPSTDRSSLTKPSYQSDRRTPVNPKLSSPPFETSTRQQSIDTQRSNVRANPPQANREQIPCQICDKLFDTADLKAHQRQCLTNYKADLERKRREIEQQDILVEVECEYCRHKYSATELDEHQDNCSSHPKNVPDESRSLSLTRSFSDANIPSRTAHFTISTSSNESIPALPTSQPATSMINLRTSKTTLPTTKTVVKEKKDKPSTIGKLLSRIWPFKKK